MRRAIFCSALSVPPVPRMRLAVEIRFGARSRHSERAPQFLQSRMFVGDPRPVAVRVRRGAHDRFGDLLAWKKLADVLVLLQTRVTVELQAGESEP